MLRQTNAVSEINQSVFMAKTRTSSKKTETAVSSIADSEAPASNSGDSQPAFLRSNNLRSRLWEAANILRGSAVDRTDWKGYILPLLFFKRISDVWDEEHARMIEQYGEDFEDEHRFQIPDGCHWDDIRSTAQNVGAALKHAMQEIERVNPDTLYRVFGTGDWGNKEKFSDELLKDLIEGFSEIGLGNTSVSTDVLGDAYEYLVGKFADVTRRNKAGEFYTPRSVVRVSLADKVHNARAPQVFRRRPPGADRAKRVLLDGIRNLAI